MQKIIVISGHPDIEKSAANKVILSTLKKMNGVSIVHLIHKYPDYQIDIEGEISGLQESEIIVLQFPFHWYGVPAIMKKWLDSITTPLVYGAKKGALKGKTLLISTTTGGPEESYSPQGYNKYTMKQFLLPLLKLGDSLGMKVLEPLVMHSATGDPRAVHMRAQEHAVKMFNELNYQYETVLER